MLRFSFFFCKVRGFQQGPSFRSGPTLGCPNFVKESQRFGDSLAKNPWRRSLWESSRLLGHLCFCFSPQTTYFDVHPTTVPRKVFSTGPGWPGEGLDKQTGTVLFALFGTIFKRFGQRCIPRLSKQNCQKKEQNKR